MYPGIPGDPRASALRMDDLLCWFYLYKLLARFGHNDRELVGHHPNFISGLFVGLHFAQCSDQLIGPRKNARAPIGGILFDKTFHSFESGRVHACESCPVCPVRSFLS